MNENIVLMALKINSFIGARTSQHACKSCIAAKELINRCNVDNCNHLYTILREVNGFYLSHIGQTECIDVSSG